MAITLIPSPGAERPPQPPVVVVNESHSVDISSSGADADCTLARERRHACSMCHKRFDRPSTLRKHLLVHTGEKAFQCEACGRRFGVASNLNRHVRRCILKPVNTSAASASHGNTGTSSSTDSSERGRSSTTSPVQEYSDRTTTTTTTATATVGTSPTTQKRRRRAPSPSRWIPASLLNFTLEASQKTASLPLPPVRPSEWDNEERDSFDENIGVAPYHPREWQYKPFLPGPGLATGFGRRSVLGGGRGQTFGSLLVF
ncbi:hypothetical protein L218DRAFT_973779 [Marasmius fiardii PR-910]|nr:hypothetical protein L218DRAFT_973779 [Marasmius fiardii PR-910]